MRYFKREREGKVVGLGYIDVENPTGMLFESFDESIDYEQKEVDLEEFKELAVKHGFCGLKPYYGDSPKSTC